MKGIIFSLLERVVTEEHGEAVWERLLDEAGVDGAYTSLGNYPDTQLTALVMAASQATGKPPNDIVRWFGVKSLPLLAESYPQFFAPYDGTRPFLLTLNEIIHSEVRKLYPGAETPSFSFDTSSPDVLGMTYMSKRKMCALAEGFIQASADHYNEDVESRQTKCMLRGDPSCVFEVRFTKRPSAPGPGR